MRELDIPIMTGQPRERLDLVRPAPVGPPVASRIVAALREDRQMDHHLLGEWSRQVRAGDSSICLGDVAHPDAWRDRRTVLDVCAVPQSGLLLVL